MASIHDKLERSRKPRVHIKYEVETEGASVEKELPFTVGVLGDFAGNSPGEPLKPLKQRKFITIDRDNFDEVMRRLKPGIRFRVKNHLQKQESEMAVELQFHCMDDFLPTRLLQQVPALKALKEVRDQLRDLLAKADRSDELETLLEKILQNGDHFDQLVSELRAQQKA